MLRRLDSTGPAPAVVRAATLKGSLSYELGDVVTEVVHLE